MPRKAAHRVANTKAEPKGTPVALEDFGAECNGYFGAAAAVSPGGKILNIKVDTFSPGLNGPGTW